MWRGKSEGSLDRNFTMSFPDDIDEKEKLQREEEQIQQNN